MLKRGEISIYFLIISLALVTIVFLAFLKNANSIASGEKITQNKESIKLAFIIESAEIATGDISYRYEKKKDFVYSVDNEGVIVDGEIKTKYPLGRNSNGEVIVESSESQVIIRKGDLI